MIVRDKVIIPAFIMVESDNTFSQLSNLNTLGHNNIGPRLRSVPSFKELIIEKKNGYTVKMMSITIIVVFRI
jgi:hypothetical protein